MSKLIKIGAFFAIAIAVCIIGLVPSSKAQQPKGGTLIMRIETQDFNIMSGGQKLTSRFKGEAVFRVSFTDKEPRYELASLSLRGASLKVREGMSGPISVMLKPESGKTSFDSQSRVLKADFVADVHYPLIDKLKGFKMPAKEKEVDDIRSYTETFSGQMLITLSEVPRFDREMKLKEGAQVDLKLGLAERVLGDITEITAKFKVSEVLIWPVFYIQKTVDIQPVFIRYTPADGCFGGSTTATTGGSLTILRDEATAMWKRCCIQLNFLPPVYVNNDNYRILSSSEEAGLKASVDDPDAIEVFFVEIGDPVGIHGGGVCYSGGTANTKVITYDTNLPINLLNLAHELGHAFGLSHPPGNSTPGSLMEPSGFCADNPGLMSKTNCDNAANPLLTTHFPFVLCIRNTNM